VIGRSLVQPGETIVGLAARLLGDPAAWRDLAVLNNLRAPYVSDVPGPGVLSPHEVILYPTSDVAAGGVASGVQSSELEALTYGRDLTAAGGDLVWSGAGPIFLVGLDNLEAALLRRLRHALGSHPFHPLTWGSLLKGQLGTVADEARLTLIQSDARRCLLADPRVSSVDLEVMWEADFLSVTGTVTPIPPGERFDVDIQL
jgi:hypothetical protein